MLVCAEIISLYFRPVSSLPNVSCTSSTLLYLKRKRICALLYYNECSPDNVSHLSQLYCTVLYCVFKTWPKIKNMSLFGSIFVIYPFHDFHPGRPHRQGISVPCLLYTMKTPGMDVAYLRTDGMDVANHEDRRDVSCLPWGQTGCLVPTMRTDGCFMPTMRTDGMCHANHEDEQDVSCQSWGWTGCVVPTLRMDGVCRANHEDWRDVSCLPLGQYRIRICIKWKVGSGSASIEKYIGLWSAYTVIKSRIRNCVN